MLRKPATLNEPLGGFTPLLRGEEEDEEKREDGEVVLEPRGVAAVVAALRRFAAGVRVRNYFDSLANYGVNHTY